MHRCAALRSVSVAIVSGLCLLAGCSGTSTPVAPNTIAVSLSPNAVSVLPGAATPAIQAVLTRSAGELNAVQLSATGAPSGVTAAFVQPAFGTYGSVSFTAPVNTVPGAYPVILTASDGSISATSTLTLTILAADSVSISPANASVLALQNGAAVTDNFTIARSFGNTSAVTVSATGLPANLNASFTQPGAAASGSVTFTTSTPVPAAGTYNITLTATDGTASSTSVIKVAVGIVATIANSVNTSQGNSGHFTEFMSTGFQPSVYDNIFFPTFPSTADLSALKPVHIRLQTVHDTIPWKANSTPTASADWSFAPMDQTVQPVLSVGDNSPVFQIAEAPSFLCDSNGNFIFNSGNLQILAQYAQNLVRYYNTGGFDWGGQHFQSASSHHITWWAIFNEPNLNNLTASQYVQLYNTLVPAMLTIDSSLKFVALELSDYSGQPQNYMPQLVLPAASGGIAAPVNAVATHFYGACNETTTDTTMFAAVAHFASDTTYIHNELQTRSDLAAIPVWVTENNVDPDFQTTTGYSHCNPAQVFVSDARGTSAFFTSWRPYVFSQLGKAGNQALHHFLYEGSNQYGEVNNLTAGKTLAYWTDYWLERTFPWDGSSVGSTILTTSTTETTPSVELLATHNTDGSVSLMVTNLAVASSTDDNGNGAPRTVLIDLSALGTFTSATEVTLNSATSLVTGPTSTAVTPATSLTVTFTGYGSTLFLLKP